MGRLDDREKKKKKTLETVALKKRGQSSGRNVLRKRKRDRRTGRGDKTAAKGS